MAASSSVEVNMYIYQFSDTIDNYFLLHHASNYRKLIDIAAQYTCSPYDFHKTDNEGWYNVGNVDILVVLNQIL